MIVRFFKALLMGGLLTVIGGCESTPPAITQPAAIAPSASIAPSTFNSNRRPTFSGGLSLPDRVVYNQKDERWAHHKLGKTSDNLGQDGCLVTATAMALTNLGFQTDPADLNARLTRADGFTQRGWLIWSGIETVTQGRAHARYYDSVSEDIIQGCLRDGYYPLARFYLPNGRSHWSMIVSQSEQGFHMRDPLRVSRVPLIFPRGTDAFKAVRCVGLKRA